MHKPFTVFKINSSDDRVTISAKLPDDHDGSPEADDDFVRELLRSGAPDWIVHGFDASGILDGVWWAQRSVEPFVLKPATIVFKP